MPAKESRDPNGAWRRFVDNPFRPANLTPEQKKRIDLQNEALRRARGGDRSFGVEHGILAPDEDKAGLDAKEEKDQKKSKEEADEG